MPIRLEWDKLEKTTLLEIVDGEWSLPDVYAMLDEADRMIASVPHRVDIIADMSSSHFSSGNLLTAFGRAQRTQPPNTGMIIVVKANRYLKAMSDVAAKMWPHSTDNFRFVDSMETAYAILQNDRAQH